MRKLPSILVALALSLAMGAAFAQSMPTLTFDGNVMVSTPDGEFVSAANGQSVVAGQSIMVPAGGTATLSYSNGAVATFGAGTHVVPAGAVVATTTTTTGFSTSAAATVGIVAGVVALASLAIDQNIDEDAADNAPPPPLSP